MNLKILSFSTTLLILIIAEILSHVNLYIWDLLSDPSSSYSEHYYNKKKLTPVFIAIEKSKTVLYILFLIFIVISIIVYFIF